jgi:predicted nucleotidyltransferase
MSSPSTLEKQILATVVYYDILDYPLTSFEVFLYLIDDKKLGNWEIGKLDRNCHLPFAICHLLDTSEYLKKHISQKYGFYFLKNREKIVQQRLDCKKIADQKWKKVKKVFWIMQITPFMKMVLVSGSLSLGNSREESDIDLIITAQKGRIWTVRTFVTLLTSILGVRRCGDKTKDKICLNHYITDKSLKIPFESLYNAQSYIHLVNVYNNEEDRRLFREFQERNNWIGGYIANYRFLDLGSVRSMRRNKLLCLVSKFFESILSGKLGSYLESRLSEFQTCRIRKDPLCRKKGGRITINNDQLEFHPDSHEGYIIPKFNRQVKSWGYLNLQNKKTRG